MRRASARGFSLVELVVVLALMTALTAVVGFAAAGGAGARGRPEISSLGRARRTAIASGQPVTVYLLDTVADIRVPVRMIPDGRVIGDGIDPVGVVR
ncbi:MAG: prepilin-type N-terminal cleavage/methylation domain-containing protein [Gemmatimonadales bacterium]|nr:prepilin-type N-terminal cleavage/methylation domain-containing protein [Gemmatimonadales bacterium]